jgi:hypothetical protein
MKHVNVSTQKHMPVQQPTYRNVMRGEEFNIMMKREYKG